ncbi:MAG: STAS domain-containing protein [Planctomycetota bacterium]
MTKAEQASIVSTELVEGVTIARVHCPAVREREAGVIQGEVIAAAAESSSRVAIDFSRVTMLPSVGLGMLISLSNACRKSGGKLALFGLDENLTQLLRLSNLDRLLIVTPDQKKAIKKVS